MRLVFYLFLISQLFNFIGVFAEKSREDTSGLNTINWKKIEENKSKPIKKIIWRSYKNDEAYFGNKNKEDSISGTTDLSNEERIYKPTKISRSSITEIEPFLRKKGSISVIEERDIFVGLYILSSFDKSVVPEIESSLFLFPK